MSASLGPFKREMAYVADAHKNHPELDGIKTQAPRNNYHFITAIERPLGWPRFMTGQRVEQHILKPECNSRRVVPPPTPEARQLLIASWITQHLMKWMNFDGFLFSLSPGYQPLAQAYDLMLMDKAAESFLKTPQQTQLQWLKPRHEMRKQKTAPISWGAAH